MQGYRGPVGLLGGPELGKHRLVSTTTETLKVLELFNLLCTSTENKACEFAINTTASL